MTSQPAPLQSLPEVFPVFPLTGALLLPRGRLPLNIFEPRYLAMTEDALAGGRVFGMVQPDPGRPKQATGPGLYRIGCLGRLSSFSETDDGRYLITLTGVTRFAIAEEMPMARGYRRVRADLAAFADDLLPVPDDTGIDRLRLMSALRPYFQRRGIDANWDAVQDMADDALVTTLAMVCPFEPAEKQALLEAPALADRTATLLTLLLMDSHEMAGDRPLAS